MKNDGRWLGSLFQPQVRLRERLPLTRQNGNQSPWMVVDLHWDGRNEKVRITGEVWDDDTYFFPDGPDLVARFNDGNRVGRGLTFGGGPIRVGDHRVNRSHQNGTTIRLYFTVEKVEDLYD